MAFAYNHNGYNPFFVIDIVDSDVSAENGKSLVADTRTGIRRGRQESYCSLVKFGDKTQGPVRVIRSYKI
jgi:hypothetical protein